MTDCGTNEHGVSDADRLWSSCSERLREQVAEPAWNMWLAPLSPIALEGSSLALAAPSAYVKEIVSSRFSDLISETLSLLTSGTVVVGPLVVRPDEPGSAEAAGQLDPPPPSAAPSSDGPGVPVVEPPGTLSTPPPAQARAPQTVVNPRLTFDAFVIGASNRFARAAAQRVAEEPGKAYNPLFIYGESGLGKTHLEHAIANYVAAHYPHMKVCYVSTETFLNDFIDAIRTEGQTGFKRRYRAYDVLLVDDIQTLQNKHQTQEEFFYTFNSLYEAEKQVVITSDRHPRAIATLEERLRSRFESGLITDIQPPEIETRLAILQKKAETEKVEMPHDVLELVATHITDNIRELEGAFIKLAAFASIHQVPVTLAVAQEVLSDVLSANDLPQVTPAQILQAVSQYYDFTVDEICSPSRSRPLVAARQMAMYLIRTLCTGYSFPDIAKVLNRADHTTVMHGYYKIANQLGEKRSLYEQVTELTHRIREAK
jgi:chromosomal replication initiator protein